MAGLYAVGSLGLLWKRSGPPSAQMCDLKSAAYCSPSRCFACAISFWEAVHAVLLALVLLVALLALVLLVPLIGRVVLVLLGVGVEGLRSLPSKALEARVWLCGRCTSHASGNTTTRMPMFPAAYMNCMQNNRQSASLCWELTQGMRWQARHQAVASPYWTKDRNRERIWQEKQNSMPHLQLLVEPKAHEAHIIERQQRSVPNVPRLHALRMAGQ